MKLGAAVAALLLLLAPATASKVHSSRGLAISFEDFLHFHGRSYELGSEEYSERQQLFEARRLLALQQNNRSDARWTAGLNKFSDLRQEELSAMHGYKPQARRSRGLSFAQADAKSKASLPEKVDWRHLKDAHVMHEQGACGSCWAISAVTVLNAHSEIHRSSPARFSAQELVDCVPNPQECGGAGGCSGATVELGIAWAVQNGLSSESAVPYTAEDGTCGKSFLQKGLRGGNEGGAAFGLTGFSVLPSNKEEPLVRALVDLGPVAVSVAASNWFAYNGGIFDDCDNVVNHAVALYGYGKMSAEKYWLVKNSWGQDWGENGYIRILRHYSEDEFCGIDKDPSKGVACKNGPKEVQVCGTCGILYDSVVPQFQDLKDA